MAADDVFPAEMPDHPSRQIPPLDDDTAGRLLSGRLDPDDAPPSYADVARLLRAAAAPAGPDELGGEEAAVAQFQAALVGGRSGPPRRSGRVRGRLVAVALTGVLVGGAAAGGAAAGGLWTTDGVPSSGRLRSPTGSVTGSGGSGLLRPGGSGAITERERAVARHGGGGGSRGGGVAHGARSVRAPEARAGKAKAPKTGKPAANKPAPKGPKAAPGQRANHARGRQN
jgi:hypothetical protein